jgi:hypothetical protein
MWWEGGGDGDGAGAGRRDVGGIVPLFLIWCVYLGIFISQYSSPFMIHVYNMVL